MNKITKEIIIRLQKYLAGEMTSEETELFKKKLQNNKSLQQTEKIINRIPDATKSYFQTKADRSEFDEIYQAVKEQQEQKTKLTFWTFFKLKNIAAILLIGLTIGGLLFYNHLSTPNQRLAADYFEVIDNYYQDFEKVRSNENDKKSENFNDLEINYLAGRQALADASYATAIPYLEKASAIATTQQNPIQDEIQLYLALAFLGNDEIAASRRILTFITRLEKIPANLQPSTTALAKQLDWKIRTGL